MTKSAPRLAWRGEADGRSPSGEGSGTARGPLTLILSPLRGARTNSFRTPQSAAEATVSSNDQILCGEVLALPRQRGHLRAAEAAEGVVVDQPRRLHEGVHD